MNFDLILAVIFYAAIFIFYSTHKQKFTRQGLLILYKTKLGILLMDKLSKKYPKLLNFLAYVSIFIGFIGMIFILYTLIQGGIKLILSYLQIIPETQPVLAPVLPGISVQGLPVLGFWHWIIAIFIVAVVHEFSHGIYSSLYKVNVKSSGFAFLGPILAAFVEPDEKKVAKLELKKQLAILSAGPFVNILLGILVILFFSFIFLPLQSNLFTLDGVALVQVEKESPAELSGLSTGTIIYEMNNVKITSQQQLIQAIRDSKENDILKLNTDKGIFYVKPEIVDNIPKVGISIKDNFVLRNGLPEFLLPLLQWFNLLFFWLWVVNLGVGLFNLLPLGPIDGGRMLLSALAGITSKKKSFKIFKFVSALSGFLIFINLLPCIIKLFKWLFGLFS